MGPPRNSARALNSSTASIAPQRLIELTTLQSYSNAVSMFCVNLAHPGYGWGELCELTFGDVPAQICFDWHSSWHTTTPYRRRVGRHPH